MGDLRQQHALLLVQILMGLDFLYKANTEIAYVWLCFPYSQTPPQTNVEFTVPTRTGKEKK